MECYAGAKVYFDGSHYIAIPHTTRPSFRRPKQPEEILNVIVEEDDFCSENEPNGEENVLEEPSLSSVNIEPENGENKSFKIKQMTQTEMFEELYKKYINLKKNERKEKIIKKMKPYFKTEKKCIEFVESAFERKLRNLICRRTRMVRKANLVDFNYFCTFTYDNRKHSEESFKKKLKIAISHFAVRNKWKYMGVWERAPETKRLHFHGLFHIPDGSMPGSLQEHNDYNFKLKKRTKTLQNSYFNRRFGRSDFEPIKSKYDLLEEMSYIMKYLEKSNEQIVYSRGLYQYFISDILEDDIVCTIGQEDRKLLLFDDFKCLNEGELIGTVSPEVIEKMRKCN